MAQVLARMIISTTARMLNCAWLAMQSWRCLVRRDPSGSGLLKSMSWLRVCFQVF